MDYVKPAMRKKPKALVIHTGTNDIQQEINTMKMVKKLVKVIKEIDSEKETEIIFSGLIQREDHDFRDQIEEINVKLKRYCESKGYRFVENSNIDGGFLNRSKLHLNKKGTALLSRNIANVLKYILYASDSDGEFIDTKISGNNEVSGLDSLKNPQNPKNIIFSYININSVRNKFGSPSSLILSHLDILPIAETKLDYSFPNAQFLINNFHQPFCVDISRNSGGLLVFVRSSIPTRMLSNYRLPPDIKAILFEINLRKEKWLFVSVCKPPSRNNQYFCDSFPYFYSSIYDNKVVSGNFNLEI